MSSPEKLAPNIFFHSLYVPKLGWMRTAYQGRVRAVRKKLKKIQPDIVHGQGTELDCALNAVFSGFPNVLTLHGNMRRIAQVDQARPFSFPWLAARLERFMLPRSDGVVCLTSHTQRAVADLASRTWVVPNAIDLSFLENQAQPRLGVSPRVLCVGRVCPLKNQNALIRSLVPLAERLKFELLFLGGAREDDAYGAEFLRLVRARSWCAHGGHAGREELKASLREAALLALPSLEENCPMVALEAIASGVAVVAAKVGGVADLVEEGKTGLLFNPQDEVSIRTAIEQALINPAATGEMGRRAKLRTQERFHPAVIARRHVEIYGEILGRLG